MNQDERLIEISDQIYELNQSIHSLMFLLAELNGRPNLVITGDNNFYFERKTEVEDGKRE